MNFALSLFHWALQVALPNIFLFYQKAKRYYLCSLPQTITNSWVFCCLYSQYTVQRLQQQQNVTNVKVLGFAEHLFILNISTDEPCPDGSSWNQHASIMIWHMSHRSCTCISDKPQQQNECTHKPEANLMAHVQSDCTPSGKQSDNYQVLEYAEVARLLNWCFDCSHSPSTQRWKYHKVGDKEKKPRKQREMQHLFDPMTQGPMHTCENLAEKNTYVTG